MPQISSPRFQPGDLVQIKSPDEIMATLDSNGALEGLPFMPEMVRFCGGHYRVFKRADKTCATREVMSIRGLNNTVHLARLRCDGAAHGGCQSGCLTLWKEDWLSIAWESRIGFMESA